jgi:hypothetical protein
MSAGQIGTVITKVPSQSSSGSGNRESFSLPDSNNAGTDPGTIAGIVIVLILGVIIIVIMVYYRFYLRFKRLKTELAHVHYIADPGTHPGQKMFQIYFIMRYKLTV